MKHKGCTVDFTSQRNSELIAAYRHAIADRPFIDIDEVSRIVVNTPCSRFWVSEERANVVMISMLKGRNVLDTMLPLKREMFQDIFNIVVRLREQNPGTPLFDIVMQAVNSPAPKFYLQPRSAMVIIYNIKNGYYERKGR